MSRRKSVSCALCGAQTWESNGVCDDCQRIYASGKRLADRFKDGGDLVVAHVDRRLTGSQHYHGRDAETRRREYGGFHDLSGELGKAMIDAVGGGIVSIFGGEPTQVEVEFRPNKYYEKRTVKVLMPKDRVAAYQRLAQVVIDALAESYDRGHDSGSSLLVKLAQGELTVAELDDASLRR